MRLSIKVLIDAVNSSYIYRVHESQAITYKRGKHWEDPIVRSDNRTIRQPAQRKKNA